MEWMLGVLKELAEKFQPQLFQQVKQEIGTRDFRLLEEVFKTCYEKGKNTSRWYDPYHVLFSTLFAVCLTKKAKESVSPLIVPAIILHDVGYTVLPAEARENWNAAQNRILHMQAGASIAANTLARIGLYSPLETGAIVGMVATHDNGYLGIKNHDLDCLALRDADRVWVMHPISFYKDWKSERREEGTLSLKDLISRREESFYRKDVPLTDLAKKWRDRQFQARRQEVKSGIYRNEGRFRRYVVNYIQSEITAGFG